MSTINKVLGELERVRANGAGYIASCPGPLHRNGDRSPSLSIRENERGDCLLHCHAGCSTRDIVVALGLRMGDLFAQKLGEPERKQRASRAVLRGLYSESLRVICATSPDRDIPRLKAASARLHAALTLQGLEARGEVRKIADYADRMLAGEVLAEDEIDALTACVEWIGWFADAEKPGLAARLQGEQRYA
jgi:hypothetical protein